MSSGTTVRHRLRLIAGVIVFVVLPTAARAQKVIELRHADSLVGLVIDGEEARELIGNVYITQENVRITCDRALQFVRLGKVHLHGNVVVRDDSMTLRAPRGTYHRDERRAEAFDSVRLDDGRVQLTAGYGNYLIDARKAFFHTRVVVIDSASVMEADTLTYFRVTRLSRARGNVKVMSKSDGVTLYGGSLDDEPERQYSRMTVDPLLVQIDTSEGGRLDTLQVRARVLEDYRGTPKRLVATDSVGIVRSELAAAGRYACLFTPGDSIHLRTRPVIWYGETQVDGDSINVYVVKRKLRRLLVMGNAFAVSRGDSLRPDRFDQLSGDRLTMLFDAGGLRRTDVDGRAISVYHLYDDSLANGLNKTSGDRIVMQFDGGKASTITVYGGVEGNYYPENMVFRREQEYAIPGFRWRTDRPRPVRFIPFAYPPQQVK